MIPHIRPIDLLPSQDFLVIDFLRIRAGAGRQVAFCLQYAIFSSAHEFDLPASVDRRGSKTRSFCVNTFVSLDRGPLACKGLQHCVAFLRGLLRALALSTVLPAPLHCVEWLKIVHYDAFYF